MWDRSLNYEREFSELWQPGRHMARNFIHIFLLVDSRTETECLSKEITNLTKLFPK
jgi:hypothetical protein